MTPFEISAIGTFLAGMLLLLMLTFFTRHHFRRLLWATGWVIAVAAGLAVIAFAGYWLYPTVSEWMPGMPAVSVPSIDWGKYVPLALAILGVLLLLLLLGWMWRIPGFAAGTAAFMRESWTAVVLVLVVLLGVWLWHSGVPSFSGVNISALTSKCNGLKKPLTIGPAMVLVDENADCSKDFYFDEPNVRLYVRRAGETEEEGPFGRGRLPDDLAWIRNEGNTFDAQVALVPRRYR